MKKMLQYPWQQEILSGRVQMIFNCDWLIYVTTRSVMANGAILLVKSYVISERGMSNFISISLLLRTPLIPPVLLPTTVKKKRDMLRMLTYVGPQYVTVTQYVTINPVCHTSSPEMSYLTRNVTITLPECHRQHVTPF